MICIKCKKEIPDGSAYCNYCGKKQQTAAKTRHHNRSNGQGTVSRDARYKNQYIAHAPATKQGAGRVYLGAFSTAKQAQDAIDRFVAQGRPELHNATFGDMYDRWAEIHFREVSDQAISLYTSMWKRFDSIKNIKMSEIRTVHFQQIINAATSKSACDTLKVMAVMVCKFAIENDVITKNYAEFVKVPKFEKKEKKIFTNYEIAVLWGNSTDERVQAILIMIYTGLRIGELLALKPEDVHLDDGYLVGGEKTDAGRNRIVPIPAQIPEISEFLRIQMNKTPAGKKLYPLTTGGFRHQFYSVLIDCNIDQGEHIGNKIKFTGAHHTPHSTRHTFASLSAAAGMRPENLQKIIGHSNFATTADVYIHQDLDVLQSEMSKLTK